MVSYVGLSFDRIAAELRLFMSNIEIVGYNVECFINQLNLCEPNLLFYCFASLWVDLLF